MKVGKLVTQTTTYEEGMAKAVKVKEAHVETEKGASANVCYHQTKLRHKT